jgi:hypothetical protein
MNKLETIERDSHGILRGRCNTILRVSLLAGCLACLVLLVYYLPEIVTGKDTFDDTRGVCLDLSCFVFSRHVLLSCHACVVFFVSCHVVSSLVPPCYFEGITFPVIVP